MDFANRSTRLVEANATWFERVLQGRLADVGQWYWLGGAFMQIAIWRASSGIFARKRARNGDLRFFWAKSVGVEPKETCHAGTVAQRASKIEFPRPRLERPSVS